MAIKMKDDDIVIHLGHTCCFENGAEQIHYKVSDFPRRQKTKSSSNWLENLNKFVELLDAKVHVDTNSPRYSHIYEGIDLIVKRVLAQLVKLVPNFANANLRRTGSSVSGVKVGLPHESDYVL